MDNRAIRDVVFENIIFATYHCHSTRELFIGEEMANEHCKHAAFNSSLELLCHTRVAIAQISENSDECEHGGDCNDGNRCGR